MATESQPVTVLGGTGYLGRQIVAALLDARYPVRVASRHADQASLPEGVEAFRCDITDKKQVREAVSGAFAVVNAVSLYHERGSATFDQIHVQGAAQVAQEASRARAGRLVLISGIGANERSASAYVRARGAGERMSWQYFLGATVLRPSVLFDQTGGFVANLEQLTRAPVVPLFGRGRTRLQPAHVADVARAVVRVIERDRGEHPVYELGGQSYAFRDCVKMDLAYRRRRRLLVPVPFLVWHAMAAVLGRLPEPPLTRDQVILMKSDNLVAEGCPSFDDLDISPRDLASVLERPAQG
ncbi:MAG: NAD(P)H-binding protein [Marinobacter sp.]|uniref:NAD-dependent epimerase/dehydratase family protein n=1 Tax=Marinobacter sp. TaxID=50741 RepID=UPI00299DA869|nr:NAD(P)H-binding protein [Marinobacter sp.]MDX1635226.1 NAD(P)H-binding protein [Marinobacter sp.]